MNAPVCLHCRGPLFDARTGTCGHTVCGACLDTRRVAACPVCGDREARWGPNRAVADLVGLAAAREEQDAYATRTARDADRLENEAAHACRLADARGTPISVEAGDLLCDQNRNLLILAAAAAAGLISKDDDSFRAVRDYGAPPCATHWYSTVEEGTTPVVRVHGRLRVVCTAPRETWIQHGAFYKPKK